MICIPFEKILKKIFKHESNSLSKKEIEVNPLKQSQDLLKKHTKDSGRRDFKISLEKDLAK